MLESSDSSNQMGGDTAGCDSVMVQWMQTWSWSVDPQGNRAADLIIHQWGLSRSWLPCLSLNCTRVQPTHKETKWVKGEDAKQEANGWWFLLGKRLILPAIIGRQTIMKHHQATPLGATKNPKLLRVTAELHGARIYNKFDPFPPGVRKWLSFHRQNFPKSTKDPKCWLKRHNPSKSTVLEHPWIY